MHVTSDHGRKSFCHCSFTLFGSSQTKVKETSKCTRPFLFKTNDHSDVPHPTHLLADKKRKQNTICLPLFFLLVLVILNYVDKTQKTFALGGVHGFTCRKLNLCSHSQRGTLFPASDFIVIGTVEPYRPLPWECSFSLEVRTRFMHL